MADYTERVAIVALSRVPGIGGATLRRLIERFGSAQDVFIAADADLLSVPRVSNETVTGMRDIFEKLASLREELLALEEEGIGTLAFDEFPPNLQAASDAPALLYVRGQFLPEDDRSIAVIGSRNASREGIAAAERIAAGLAEQQFTIVSGLAIGVDAAAHRGALEAGGRTIGVLGSGIRRMFPPENAELAERIVQHGVVVSEFEPNVPVNPRQLMMRDRIVSGLSLGVVVVEAGAKSGSLDTAERARRQGRAVFVIDWPGNAEEHAGNRRLIRAGATGLPCDSLPDWQLIADESLRVERSVCEDPATNQPPRLF